MEIIISAHGANGSRNYSIHQGLGNQVFNGNLKELTAFMIKNYPDEAIALAREADTRHFPSSIRFGLIDPSEKFKFLESLSGATVRR
jgi:hypothetical protein